jgi:two-component system, OmpR family, response regulator TctD
MGVNPSAAGMGAGVGQQGVNPRLTGRATRRRAGSRFLRHNFAFHSGCGRRLRSPPTHMKLLLIEDNPTLAHWLAKTLTQDAFVLDTVNDGDAADQLLKTNQYDVVLLDLNLPKLSGKNVLRRLRERHDSTPVLILTASGSVDEKVECLGAGADDYLVKPFEVRELVARIKVLVRRQTPSKASELACGDLAYDINTRQFSLAGMPLGVTPRERAVLETLMLRLGKTVSKTALMESIFTLDDDPSEDAIEIYIHRLRKKLDASSATIVTLRGLGYLLRKKEDDQ